MKQYVLGADVGGTNTKVGIAEIDKDIKILFSFNFQSQKLKSVTPAINFVLSLANAKHMDVKKACIAGAGPVKAGKLKLIHLNKTLDKKNILKKTSLKKLKLLNDFEAIGYGLEKNNCLIIGAGTGLGMAVVKNNKVIATEKGHTLFEPEDELDKRLATYIKKIRKIRKLEYEDLLSGEGLENIYRFIKKKSKSAEYISKHKNREKAAWQTFELFAEYYARAINDFAKQAKVHDVYIAGGIIRKNKDVLKKEIKRHLDNISVFIVNEENMGLLGACKVASRL